MGDACGLEMEGLSTKERARLSLEELVSGIEASDPYLHGHSRRVARHSWMIARKMGLASDEVARVRTAAAIHDVGKIHTPTAILHKPARLTDEEYDVIKRHPGDGAQMADVLRDAALASIVRHHHERMDGSGYPDALRGDEIPLGARIIAVADTFDAITSERPYRHASAHKKAIDILRAEAAAGLDPDVVRAFCGHYAGRTPIAMSSFVVGLPDGSSPGFRAASERWRPRRRSPRSPRWSVAPRSRPPRSVRYLRVTGHLRHARGRSPLSCRRATRSPPAPAPSHVLLRPRSPATNKPPRTGAARGASRRRRPLFLPRALPTPVAPAPVSVSGASAVLTR